MATTLTHARVIWIELEVTSCLLFILPGCRSYALLDHSLALANKLDGICANAVSILHPVFCLRSRMDHTPPALGPNPRPHQA